MYKVYVVDDAALVRKEIVLTTPWKQVDCVVVGQAADGRDALKEIPKLQPDIVITDIKMAYIDGLELIQALKNEGVEAEFIVISGYSEFEYAFHAIKLEVQNYILKPICDEELLESIQKSIQRIEERRRIEMTSARIHDELISDFKDKNLNAYLREAIEYLRENFSLDLIIRNVANHLSISESYLAKLFKTEINCTFVEFLTRTRIYESTKLMKNKNMPIYEIAERVGYKDYRYFSMVFKKLIGVTPKEYQKKT